MRQTFCVTSQGQKIISRCLYAKTFSQRLFGLIPNKKIEMDQGLLFSGSCQQLHSLFMSFPIEAFFLDENKKIIKIVHLKPWRVSPIVRKARYVLETAAGIEKIYNLKIGQQMEFTI